MHSRQRIITTLNHQEPDCMPLDCGSVRSAGIHVSAYARLKKILGIKQGHIFVYDLGQQLALVEPCVATALGIDALNLECRYITDEHLWKEWRLTDGTEVLIPFFYTIRTEAGEQYVYDDQGGKLAVIEQGAYFPRLIRNDKKQDISDLIRLGPKLLEKQLKCNRGWSWLTMQEYLWWHNCKGGLCTTKYRQFYQSTDQAVVATFSGSLFQRAQNLCGLRSYLEQMTTEPEVILELNALLTEIYLDQLDRILASIGDYIDVLVFEDDFGSQQGPLISPHMYDQFFKPFHCRMWQRVKELCAAKVMLHSCGSVAALLEAMLDAGLDIIHPVQQSAKGMRATELKRKYTERLCFWGVGYDDPVYFKNSKDPNSDRNWQQQINLYMEKGGFVFQPVNNILPQHNIRDILDIYYIFRK